MESTFWGVEVKPGKAQPFVPPPLDAKLHLSQVCLYNQTEVSKRILSCQVLIRLGDSTAIPQQALTSFMGLFILPV